MTTQLLLQICVFIFLLMLGLVIGSFLNVVIYRLPLGASLISPRSSCVNCGRVLGVFDLIPAAAYIMLGGRCRYCRAPISPRYPFGELLAAMIIIITYIIFDFSPLFFKYTVLFYILQVISFIDLEKYIIPNRLVLPLFIWSLIWQFLYPTIPLSAAGLGLLAGAGLFLLIAVLSKGGMGGGDIKLMAVLGLAAGWPLVLVVFLFAFLLGAVVGLFLLLIGKKSRRDPLPFAPFLSLSFIISILWGLQFWHWYMLYL